MAIAAKSAVKFNPEQYAAVIRESAQRLLETAQVKAEQVQSEGRVVLAKQILKGADRASELSKALIALSKKVAPVSKPKAKAAPKAKAKPVAKKVVAKVATKPRTRKVAATA
jgi:DNA-binding protein H-NS